MHLLCLSLFLLSFSLPLYFSIPFLHPPLLLICSHCVTQASLKLIIFSSPLEYWIVVIYHYANCRILFCCMNMLQFFCCLLIAIWSVSFFSFAFTHEIIMHILWKSPCGHMFYSSYVELLQHMLSECFSWYETTKLLSKAMKPFYIPISNAWDFQFLYTTTTSGCIEVL